ncbi:MAG: V-type ATP synthase subunit E [Rectinemataceae bacterium]|nr:V-type ATP synthase subunit E [Rectinemataceae bacterium]
MDIQLQELLDKIKTEGVESARGQAAKIIAGADAKAEGILADVEREARSIRETARAEAAKNIEAGNAALTQSARDLILSFKDRIAEMLKIAVMDQAAASLTPENLAEILPEVLKKSFVSGTDDISIFLSPDIFAKLDKGFAASLSAELKRGVDIKPFPGVVAGFRIVEKNGSVHYDFSAEALAELLARRLNARLAETVRSAVKKG